MDRPEKPLPERLAEIGNAGRIAVFRTLKLGDMLCAVPAFRALRAHLAGADITLIGLPWAKEFARRYAHCIDRFVEFPGYPGLPERTVAPESVLDFLADMQRRQFDLVIQMHGSGGITNPLCALMGSRHLAGFYEPGQYCPDPAYFMIHRTDRSEVTQNASLIARLSGQAANFAMEFPIEADDDEALAALHLDGVLAQNCAVVHPGAREATRRWDPAHFAVVADHLATRGFSVILSGMADEAALTAEVGKRMRAPAIDLAPLDLPLGPLAALLRRTEVLVCNDTGVSHLAAAVGTPSVIVFLASDPNRWAPLDRDRHRVVDLREGGSVTKVIEAANSILLKKKNMEAA
jgi:ADP-heptose:LPS heptosyltransferase